MDTELKEKFDSLGKMFEQYKAAQDECIKQEQLKGHVDPLLKEQEEKLNEKMGQLEDEIAKIKSSTGWKQAEKEQVEEKEAQAFEMYLKTGYDSLDLDSQNLIKSKAAELSKKYSFAGSDPKGGFLVRPTFSNRINQYVFENSPIRQIADVQTIGSSSWKDLYDESEVSSGWVGETQARPETTTPELNEVEIPVNEIYAKPKATQNLIDDAEVSIEQWLLSKVGDDFLREEGAAFVSGDAVKKPKGFLSYTAGDGFDKLEQFTSAASGAVGFDDLIDLVDLLLPQFESNARFVMSRGTRTALRKLKDQNDQYLWQPDNQGGIASLLLGYPVTIATDMPDIAGSALSIAFGDFRRGYKILDRQGVRVLRDPYTESGFIKYYTTKRVGGGVQHFQAIKLLKVKA